MSASIDAILEKHFEIALNAPDSIQRLREIILTLGMQGKLVPQDPQDEPASELLKKIEIEKKRLVKEGKIKEPKPLPEIMPEEEPYQLPKEWKWVRIRSTGYDWGQKEPDCNFTYIDVGSIDNSVGKIINPQTLSPEEAPSRARKIVKQGTVIYSTVRPYLLNMAVVASHSPEPIASTAFAVIHPYSMVTNTFIFYFLKSPSFTKYVSLVMKGVAYPAINDSDFFLAAFPLPPLAEQKRIVAKIDELMKRCDDLEKLKEALSKKKEETHRAATAELLEAFDSHSVSKAFSFIYKRFNEFYDSKEYVAELKKTILQLAVMGRLVSQDANDEPARELLTKIEAEKKRLVKEGKIKGPKSLPEIKPDEVPYQVPQGWEWVRLGEIGNWRSGSTPNRAQKNYYEGEIPWVKSGEVKQGIIRATEEHISEKALAECSLVLNPSGSILVAMYGANIGDVGVLDIIATTNQAVCACKPSNIISSPYLYLYLKARKQLFINQGAGAAQPNISKEKIINTLFTLPPLTEQKRIVVKVDQLMALCDRLFSSIDASREKQKALLESIIQRMEA